MKHHEYFEIIEEQLEKQKEEFDNIEKAAQYCASSIENERVIHVFGTGHSQMFAMEVYYRAGGLVPVNALLGPHYSLSPKPKLSTYQERVEGFADKYLELENTSADDTMIVVSISGRNASSVDMALAAKKMGMKVIALTSLNFSSNVSARHSSGKLLKDVADVVIDIKCELGDAVLEIDGIDPKFSGTSTVLGMTVMESMVGRTVEICHENDVEVPIFVSSNLDRGDKINAEHLENYKDIISGF